MHWLFNTDPNAATRNVDNDITNLDTAVFTYGDTIPYRFPPNIFVKQNQLENIFSPTDANFFVDQINNREETKWKAKFSNVILVNEVQLNEHNLLDKYLYSYSLPVFSLDKQHVIIIEQFFCGLLCGGGHYSLYQRQAGNTWKKIKEFNEWSE